MLQITHGHQGRITFIKGAYFQHQRFKHAAFERFRRLFRSIRRVVYKERRFFYLKEKNAFDRWLDQQRASQRLVDRY